MVRQPTPEDKFSFGLWTVGWQAGVDPFGDADPAGARPGGAPCTGSPSSAPGASPSTTTTSFPFDADEADRGRRIARFRGALDETGLVVPMVTTNLFTHPVFKDGGFTSNDRAVRRFALRKVAAQPRPGRRARRVDLRDVGRS